jgi:ADP-dependent NAD(P)H-hydrate dehydratase / NAD(P)H-hydrate epimerase
MRPILTPGAAAELDRGTQARGVAAAELMDRAGRAVARAVVDRVGGGYGRRAVVVCGKGNNGGDGLVAARHLARWGMAVVVLLLERGQDLREPAATQLDRLGTVDRVRVRRFSPVALERELARADVVVDAIFGTGFRGQPEDAWAEAIVGIGAADAPVVAVDIPSGVDGATGDVAGVAVWADLTVTFGAAKVGAVVLPGAERAGAIRVVDIGFPWELIQTDTFLFDAADVRAALPVRPVDTHKRASGVVLVVAGSREMCGAPRLIARAAARVGAGLVTLAVPEGSLAVVSEALSEPTFRALPETEVGSVSPEALPVVLEAAERADAIALGPGLSTHPRTMELVRELVRVSPIPIVLDADGLTAFTGDARALRDAGSDTVLTPHAGEFARLAGPDGPDPAHDPMASVRWLAAACGCTTLLKGSRTLVAEPGGLVTVNPTGSPILATAGSGDVLTGMISGLLARGSSPAEAARAGAYLHGLAGTVAGRERGEGTVAGDLIEAIPAAVGMVEAG